MWALQILLFVSAGAVWACIGPHCGGGLGVGRGRPVLGRRRGPYDCQITLNFPYEKEDELRELRARHDYYPRVVELQRGWWDPYAYRPRGQLPQTAYGWLNQVESIRLSKCGIMGGRRNGIGGRWKRQAPAVAVSGGNAPLHRGGAPPRQEYRTMSPAQRQRFANAVRALKASGHYDAIALRHRQEDARAAHGGAAFLPWHRMYMLQFEVALQTVDPGVILPFWDPILDGRLGDRFQDTCLFDWYSLGQWRGGPVRDGIFANFRAVPGCEEIGMTLTRQVTQENALYTSGDIRRYDQFRTYHDIAGTSSFEDDHAFIHVTLGGHMDNLNCAPNDPVFFMFHSFVDYLFYRFRRVQTTDKATDWTSNVTQYNGLHDPMLPFENTFNIDGLRHIPLEYAESPSMLACNNNNECHSDMLWCNQGRCTAMIREGAQCFQGNPASCYCARGGAGMCPGGVCRCH